MKTTRKEFKVQVQHHIIIAMADQYGNYEKADTIKDQLLNVITEYNNHVVGSRIENLQERFIYFLTALPSCINIEFTQYDIHLTLKEWFENCGAEYTINEPNEKEEKLYYSLIYREFNAMCKQHNIIFN